MAEADSERARALLSSVNTNDAGVAELLATIAEQYDLDHGLELQGPDPQPERADELQQKWGTEIGQLWSIGSHRLVCGDSRDKLLVERLVGNGKVRVVWTDAPYGVNLAAKNEFLNRSDRGGRVQKPIANDDLPPDEIKTLFASALKS